MLEVNKLSENMEIEEKGTDKKVTVSIAMKKSEKQELCEIANNHGLNLSSFFRMAAIEYIRIHGWEE